MSDLDYGTRIQGDTQPQPPSFSNKYYARGKELAQKHLETPKMIANLGIGFLALIIFITFAVYFNKNKEVSKFTYWRKTTIILTIFFVTFFLFNIMTTAIDDGKIDIAVGAGVLILLNLIGNTLLIGK